MKYDLNDKNTAAVQNKINQIILDALRDKSNWKDGEVDWSFVDGDLHCDESSQISSWWLGCMTSQCL